MRLKADNMKILAGMIVFGSIWGLMECVLGGVKLGNSLDIFPMGALLGGLVGLGLMAYTRRTYNVLGMQLGMAIIAGLLRFWAPIGSCVICSALAIVAEGMVFEMIFNQRVFDIRRSGNTAMNRQTLAFLGVIAGFTIYTVGYMFTQIFTPLLTTGAFNISNFGAVLPLILGRGFFASVLGGVALPVAVTVKQLDIDFSSIGRGYYYGAASAITAFCWLTMFALFYL